MGNAYFQRIDSIAGTPIRLRNAPAVYCRVGKDGRYFWLPRGIGPGQEFDAGTVIHLRETDLLQEVYGLPEYMSALQAGLLNEAATIFRRRYFLNGSHMGYILYINDATFENADAEALEQALEQSKGPGNFKNLLLHLPGGDKDGVQILPVGEAAGKDEFLGIKNTTRDDVLAAHRVPPVLIGVVPQVNGGFGKPGEAADVFFDCEIVPLQTKMLEVNEHVGRDAVAFEPYVRQALASSDTAAPVL